MDINQPGFTRFSRFGDNIGRLHVTAALHAEALDGTDSLEITCTEDLSKNDYIVWQDRRGLWHEHIVDNPVRTHDDTGAPMTVAMCINSIAETWDDYVEDRRPSGLASAALSSILATSRWRAGTCTQSGVASHTFYHISVREAINELIEAWGGEMETSISCDGDKVTAREVGVMAARGDQHSPKRFTWTKDLISISRSVASDNPKSRIYAYGRGEETDSGGYGRRLTIESVNNGKPYVEDAEATSLWGHPDANGTIQPACGIYVNEMCDNAATLLSEAMDALNRAKMPIVTYKASVVDLASFGRDWEDVALGDLVTIIDKGFSEEGLQLKGRVSKLDRDLITYETTVTFGNLVDALASPWQRMQSSLASLTKRSVNWDLAGAVSDGWLGTLISGLNAAYNQAGTYHYSSFEQGEIWSNVPIDEHGRATRPGGWAMNINGLGFRLASSLNADGSWNWRTFGTGSGFTADEIIAGTLKTGVIRDATGNGNYWNLDTGEFRMAVGVTVGGKTVAAIADEAAGEVHSYVDQSMNSVDTQFTLVTESLSEMQAALDDKATPEDLANLEGRVVPQADERIGWLSIKQVNGQPALMLGQSDNDLNAKLTNTELGMYQGATRLATYGGKEGATMPKATVEEELHIGSWMWVKAKNGNLALKYVGS